MNRVVREAICSCVGLLPNRMMLGLKKFCKAWKPDYIELLDTIRLRKFVERTDFEKLDTSSWPVCSIEDGRFDYVLVNVCFINNMLKNIVYCLSEGYRPVVNFHNSKSNVNFWEQFFVQPYTQNTVDKIGGGVFNCV